MIQSQGAIELRVLTTDQGGQQAFERSAIMLSAIRQASPMSEGGTQITLLDGTQLVSSATYESVYMCLRDAEEFWCVEHDTKVEDRLTQPVSIDEVREFWRERREKAEVEATRRAEHAKVAEEFGFDPATGRDLTAADADSDDIASQLGLGLDVGDEDLFDDYDDDGDL